MMKQALIASALIAATGAAAAGAATPEEIVRHHVAAANAGNLDGLMSDYADDAVSLMPGETSVGKAAVRAGFSHIVGPAAKQKMVISLVKTSSAGPVGMFYWKTDTGMSGNESFLIRNGKIIADAVWFDAPPK